MGRKGKHKGRKKDRREAALAEAADALRDRGARGRLAPELWLDPMASSDDGTAPGPDAVDEPAASSRSASRDPAGTSDPAELAARLAGLGTVLQRLLGRLDSAGSEGLTRARLSALALLVLGGPRRLGELASAERVRPPTMSRLVDAMEADGWVMRVPDPARWSVGHRACHRCGRGPPGAGARTPAGARGGVDRRSQGP